MEHFLLGVDPDFCSLLEGTVRDMTVGLVHEVLDRIRAANADIANAMDGVLQTVVEQQLESLFESWDHAQGDYFRPVLGTVAILPKDELAAMAESLVNLTKFRRRVTPVAETVSGPIDVAVITKADGFVWINRKHYFDPKLNPRVLSRLTHPGEHP